MAVIDGFRKIADRLRAIPGNFGLREYTVELHVVMYSDEISGRGRKIRDEKLPITVANGVSPDVKFPTQAEVAWGFAGQGLAIVGPFTPQYSTDGGVTVGGVARELLDGTDAQRGAICRIVITGPNFPNGCYHRIQKYQVDNPLEVVLICLQSEPLR